MDNAITGARDKHGQHPWELIGWRNYSHIGGSEIDRVRDEFLRDATTATERRTIKLEYRHAKARYTAAVRACSEWDREEAMRHCGPPTREP